jgi:hypothetical protein
MLLDRQELSRSSATRALENCFQRAQRSWTGDTRKAALGFNKYIFCEFEKATTGKCEQSPTQIKTYLFNRTEALSQGE